MPNTRPKLVFRYHHAIVADYSDEASAKREVTYLTSRCLNGLRYAVQEAEGRYRVVTELPISDDPVR